MKYLYRSTITRHFANNPPTIQSTGPARQIGSRDKPHYVSEKEYRKMKEEGKI